MHHCENMLQFSSSDSQQSCACKGVRTCLTCESKGKKPITSQSESVQIYNYCVMCGKGWLEEECQHPSHSGQSIDFEGVYIQQDFLEPEEEDRIVADIYETPFVESQSGRRKQDYGPKVNFKRKKVQQANFSGLPEFSRQLYERMKTVEILADFTPVEQCHLEYKKTERGSSIDPHFDDFWLWGERLVTINLLSDTVLCFTRDEFPDIEIHVPMTQRSLIVVSGEARTKWKHAIHRSDITSKRLAITLRELSQEFSVNGPREKEGKELLDIALSFRGRAVRSEKL